MSFTKKMTVVATGAALGVAFAVPAMALENEFHGMFAVRGFNSNYLAGTAGRINIEGDTTTSKTWIEQRARIMYTAKANDNLKLVTGFEVDSYWGKDSYDSIATRRNSGGALGSDSVSLETKWVYLDFNDPFMGANFKVGMQGLNDSYKGLLFGLGADAAGLQMSKAFGPVTGTFGWFRLDDSNAAARGAATFTNGKTTRDLWVLDANVAPSKDMKFGGSYYFLNNDNVPTTGGTLGANDYAVHMLGARGSATFGPATVDGFGIYQFGTVGTTHVNAFAGNVAAKVAAGPGAVKVSALYVSGNSGAGTTYGATFGGNAFVNVQNTTSAVFSENGVAALGNTLLLARNPKESTNEQAIIAESGNGNMGIIGGAVGYDLTINKFFGSFNVAMAATAKDQAARTSNYMGTEINTELGYKMFDNMSAIFRAGYVFLGDYYDKKGSPANTDPANPYAAQLVLSYIF